MSWLKNILDGGAGEAQKKNEANSANLASMLSTQYGLGMGFLQQMLQQYDDSYADAKASLSSAGTVATNQIIEGGKQTNAANNQSLIDSGLGSTTLKQNMANQTQGQVSNALAGLGEQLGAQNAGLAMQHASNKAGGLMSLADFAMSKVGQQNAITPQYTGGQGLLGGLGSGLGQMLGNINAPKKEDK